MKSTTIVRLAAGALLLAGALFGMVFLPVQNYLATAIAWIRDLGPLGPFVLAALYIPACLLMAPGTILSLGAGFAFGVVRGSVAVSVGSTVGATAAFLAGRTLARGLVEARIARHPTFAAIDQAVGRQGFKIVLLTRLSPILPFNLLNYAFGVTRVSLRDYVLASWIGMLPATVVYVYLGSVAKSLADVAMGRVDGGAAQLLLLLVGLGATIAAAAYIARLAHTELQKAGVSRPENNRAMSDPSADSNDVDPEATFLFANRDPGELLPHDAHNRGVVANVRPSPWSNPQPASRYNLVVVGAGAAGLVTAAGAAGLGARVALIERHLLGGDCLIAGCVPSKALLRASRAYAAVRDGGSYGVRVPPGATVDFAAVMERMRRLRAAISAQDAAERFRNMGIDIYFGHAAFASHDTIRVEGAELRFRRAVIATGGRPSAPPIEGIKEAGYLTNETVFSLVELPRRLAIVGAGPIGCELAQAFARFGSHVDLLEAARTVLPREEEDASEIIRQTLVRDGVNVHCNCKVLQVNKTTAGKRILYESAGEQVDIMVDEVLVAVGRRPNVEGLGLEAAGVQCNEQGVTVNDRLQTTNPRVYAAGDICSRYKFTHAADAMARIAVQNALFFGRAKASALTIPWCTYTDPEVAHVGLYEHEAQEQGISTETFEHRMQDVDRAILDGQTEGFVRVLVRRGSDKILGATIVASHAGDLISEVTLAMVARRGLRSIAQTIHPYPTQAEAIRKVADAYNRTRLTPRLKHILQRWFEWTR